MARPGSEHPTELELEILKVLWDESPLPVREVRARLEAQAGRTLAHSSVITMLNIMHHKTLRISSSSSVGCSDPGRAMALFLQREAVSDCQIPIV